jgi:S1-C subfamily serine protease
MPAADAPEPAGEVSAAELEALLVIGPQGVLAATDFEPVVRGRRFVGWRVISFRAGGPLAGTRSIGPGDVITLVNGVAPRTPDDVMAIVRGLASASSLTIALLRDGKPLTLEIPIVDRAGETVSDTLQKR